MNNHGIIMKVSLISLFRVSRLYNSITREFHRNLQISSTRMSNNSNNNGCVGSNDLFVYKVDRFSGATVHSQDQYCDDETFHRKLQCSLQKWKTDKIRAVWFHVLLNHTNWVPILSQYEFKFHRVPNCGQSVIMCKWLPEDQPNSIPPYAHTMVGVGGIVVNKKNEVLVVQQRFGSRVLKKFPGGYVEPGEDLSTAAIREVEEETGIRTVFKFCLAFRHTHGANFNCSDLYFLVSLEPLNENYNEDSDEVEKVEWMKIEEFLNNSETHELNRQFLQIYLNYTKNNIAIVKEDGLHPVTKKPYSLYCVMKESDS